MDVSESECNIVHKNLSQNNPSVVPDNVITELKEDEHNEPSVIEKGTNYFNIFECGRNLLDQLDVMYQRAFMVSPVQEALYQPSPAQERYYDKMAEILIKANVGSDGTISNDELHKAITQNKSEKEVDHDLNMFDMTQVDDYKLPWKGKDATMFNNLAYTFFYSCKNEKSDSSKQVEASKQPITETHIFNRVCNLLDRTISVKPDVTIVGIIG